MSTGEKPILFRPREFKGSRLRCLLLTHRDATNVAKFLTSLVTPYATVSAGDRWAPRGFLNPTEAKLGDTDGFLSEQHRQNITSWWLAKPERANTPNWDLVSTCHIGNANGLILVEAKAHAGEMGDDRCGAKNQQNYRRIRDALCESTNAWNELQAGFSLSADSHYQLSNRFAFAWRVAKIGTPVVLVYLGFLNANEMEGSGRVLLRSHLQWRNCVVSKSAAVVPENAWDRTFEVNGTALTVLIRSAIVSVNSEVFGNTQGAELGKS
jgi:hypothetical protein